MRNILFSLSLLAFLSGCATPEQKRDYAAAKSDSDLCRSWMNKPSINQYSSAMKKEIDRRGIDCNLYGDVSSSRKKANQDLYQSMRNFGNVSPARVHPGNATSLGARLVKEGKTFDGKTICYYSDGSADNIGYSAICPITK